MNEWMDGWMWYKSASSLTPSLSLSLTLCIILLIFSCLCLMKALLRRSAALSKENFMQVLLLLFQHIMKLSRKLVVLKVVRNKFAVVIVVFCLLVLGMCWVWVCVATFFVALFWLFIFSLSLYLSSLWFVRLCFCINHQLPVTMWNIWMGIMINNTDGDDKNEYFIHVWIHNNQQYN